MEQGAEQGAQGREATGLVIVTLALLIGLGVAYSGGRRAEIMANWATYRTDPLLLFMAPFFKPDADPRSRFQFATDNYSEVVKIFMDKVIAVALTPVYQIFGVLSSSLGTAAGGLGAIKALLGKMFGGFQAMVDVFMRRFGSVGNALTNTFRQLLQSLQHVWATAVASLYTGLSTVYAMMNTMRLMITIVITILIVLAVMMFFFFFALWPLLPLIILGGVMVGGVTEKLGLPNDGSGAISSLACFAPSTRIVMEDGSDIALSDVRLADRLEGKGVVEGILWFEEDGSSRSSSRSSSCSSLPLLYSLDGVLVTGSHIVWEGDVPLLVQDHKDAKPHSVANTVLCLLTSHRRIPVLSNRGVRQYADWEELDDDDEEALLAWYNHVDLTLNASMTGGVPSEEEAGCPPDTLVGCPGGFTPIQEVSPGSIVLDAEGSPTNVTGVVRLLGGTKAVGLYGLTTGCWVKSKGKTRWEQRKSVGTRTEAVWYHLFTEAGTFMVRSSLAGSSLAGLRDFSDVGAELPATYSHTLTALTAKKAMEAAKGPRIPKKSSPLESNVVQENNVSGVSVGTPRRCEPVHVDGIHELSFKP